MSDQIKFNKDVMAEKYFVEHWLVGEGDTIVEGQQLLSVRADGQLFIIHAPFDGILISRTVLNGQEFSKDEVLGEIITQEEAGDIKISDTLTRQDRRIIESLHTKKSPSAQIRKKIHVKATPSARQAARESRINLEFVSGSGPDGRIQLSDVTDYRKQMEEKEKKPKEEGKQDIVYGLPLTPLAKRLAAKSNLDVSKIPAPPGAVKIRKKDVERFLRNPESAHAILEREYSLTPVSRQETIISEAEESGTEIKPTEEISDQVSIVSATPQALPLNTEVAGELPEPKQQVIRLTTEIPSEAVSQGIIELDQKTKLNIPALEGPGEVPALEEPVIGPGKVIRLTTDVPLSALSNGVIELEQIRQIDVPMLMGTEDHLKLVEPESTVIRLGTGETSVIPSQTVIELDEKKTKKPLLINEPETILSLNEPETLNAASVIRLPSDEESAQKGEDVILLPEYDLVDLFDRLSVFSPVEEAGQLLLKEPRRIVRFTLSTLVKKENTDEDLLSLVLADAKKVYSDHQLIYLKNIDNPKPSLYTEDKNQEEKTDDKLKLESADMIITNLLNYELDDVSGMIDSVDKVVLYLFKASKNISNIPEEDELIRLALEFDSNVLSPVKGLEMIETIKDDLEKLEVGSDEQK